MNGVLYAYYSGRMAEEFGTVFYMDLDGRRVGTTLVVKKRRGVRRRFRWDDLRYVGRVLGRKVLGMDETAQDEADLWDRTMKDMEKEEEEVE
jgi:hypothetical protein